jgi:hypothetical protein
MKCFGNGVVELSEEGTTMILYEAFAAPKLSTWIEFIRDAVEAGTT